MTHRPDLVLKPPQVSGDYCSSTMDGQVYNSCYLLFKAALDKVHNFLLVTIGIFLESAYT
jgi:hypothetical protein